jgi:exopolysaccharide biosynthesis polyprenyl glycosylphosphotransferase
MIDQKPLTHTSLWRLRIGERQVFLVFGDLLVSLISLFLSLYYWGMNERFIGFSREFLEKRVPLWFYILPLIWILIMVELYDVHRASDWGKTVKGVAIAAIIFFMLYLLLYFYYSAPAKSLLPRRGVASFLISVSILTLLWRRIYIQIFCATKFMRRVLVVGGGRNGRLFLNVIHNLKNRPFIVVGIVDDDPEKLNQVIETVPVIGNSRQLLDLIQQHQISDLIVAIGGEMHPATFQAILEAQERGVDILRMPVAYEELINRVPILSLEADWILRTFVDQTRGRVFYEMGKRILDVIGALVGLVLVLLVLPFIFVMMLLDDGLPIFYGQTRSGRGGMLYEIIKFRTMRRDAEANGTPQWAQEGDTRATRVGRILRRTHLDELPQFINVLRGEMSLVGPRAERPELVELFQKHIPFYRARLLVKPGITGWAQVNFGYAASIEETIVKLEYDLYYIKHRSLWLDCLIILRTPATVLGFRGR